jgi:hypothetical protein
VREFLYSDRQYRTDYFGDNTENQTWLFLLTYPHSSKQKMCLMNY